MFVRKAISPQMWAYFPVLYQLWSTECFDYFDGTFSLHVDTCCWSCSLRFALLLFLFPPGLCLSPSLHEG